MDPLSDVLSLLLIDAPGYKMDDRRDLRFLFEFSRRHFSPTQVAAPHTPHQFTLSNGEGYSARRAIMGSTAAARRAGMKLADVAEIARTVATAASVPPSQGWV